MSTKTQNTADKVTFTAELSEPEFLYSTFGVVERFRVSNCFFMQKLQN